MYNTQYLPENFEQRMLEETILRHFHLIEHAFQILTFPHSRWQKRTAEPERPMDVSGEGVFSWAFLCHQ